MQDGNATSVQAFDWDLAGSCGVVTNLSVWTDLKSLWAFVHGDMHVSVLRRQREWFTPNPARRRPA